MTTVFLSLGTNRGNRRLFCTAMAQKLLSVTGPGMRLSPVMETEPLEMPSGQRWFLNIVARCRFKGTPEELLAECNRIERELGRRRGTRSAVRSARTADIDILLFGHEIIRKKYLTVPHPRILSRRFCLEGLCRVGPYWKLPGTGLTMAQHFRGMRTHVSRQRIIFLPWQIHRSGLEQSR
jgi:2-amino-4-hydroxy-6-hydroxymethyldihydropteridine diphosphokinase